MIDRLPFDIWMTVSSHLTVRSILNLACVRIFQLFHNLQLIVVRMPDM